MRTFLECVPCFVRQAFEAASMATGEERVREQIMRSVLRKASELSFSEPPSQMAFRIHRIVQALSGNADPYRALKERFNRVALDAYAELSTWVREAARPLETAVRLAIAGNIIDFGVRGALEESDLWRTVREVLRQPFAIDHMARLEERLRSAGGILYLADNAGEIVFDRLLVEQLPAERVTFVVKAQPIINDATMDDAKAVGLTELVEVIDNGADAPGTVPERCSEPFRRRFEQADVVISKGQANYETLSDAPKEGLFFLLKVKCPVIARDIGCKVGDIVVKENAGA